MTTIADQWNELVTTALLGTDRRDPPDVDGPLGDLVADTARSSPSDRMLAQVAACVTVRRAGVLPGDPAPRLAPPVTDERPVCVPAAVDRWNHIITSWPVLEDEWTLTLIERGWRASPELAPAMLWRHRGDEIRRARAVVALGPIAEWLVEHLPDLASSRLPGAVDSEALAELPPLPIPPELDELLSAPGSDVGRSIGVGLESGQLGEPHRAVLVNLVARMAPDGCADAADVLNAVDPHSSGYGLATVLADLATTRSRMLDELSR
jgi:hypothetical protein